MLKNKNLKPEEAAFNPGLAGMGLSQTPTWLLLGKKILITGNKVGLWVRDGNAAQNVAGPWGWGHEFPQGRHK